MTIESTYHAIEHFLESMGLGRMRWQGESLTIDLERERHLCIDLNNHGLLFSLGIPVHPPDIRPTLVAALRAVHYKQALPFAVQAGLRGESTLYFTVFFPASELSISNLNHALNCLNQLQGKTAECLPEPLPFAT